MPRQKPGRSRQCYATPLEFIRAVELRFGQLDFDLAATPKNAKAERYFTRRQNALKRAWPDDLRLWLNPPYGHIMPWAAKCELEATGFRPRGSIFFLVPASVCSRWFVRHVWGKATVNLLAPRLCFIKDEPYPKDLILCVYRRRRPAPDQQFVYWDWQNETLTNQKGITYGYKKAA